MSRHSRILKTAIKNEIVLLYSKIWAKLISLFWWILRHESALRLKVKKILTPKITFRGLYLYYS